MLGGSSGVGCYVGMRLFCLKRKLKIDNDYIAFLKIYLYFY